MKTTRREFIKKGAAATALTLVGVPVLANSALSCAQPLVAQQNTPFQFRQIPLPYEYNSLEPIIDVATMEIHYSKHHAAYLKNVNEAIVAEKINEVSELSFFKNIASYSVKARNNGGGVYNHNFFWQCMREPKENNLPDGKLAEAINQAFGSFQNFKDQFSTAAISRFGSGWAWLVKGNNALLIGSTPNQDNPLMSVSDFKGTPLLALDVWEHAYYLKYQNKRAEYVANWWSVVNWDFVSKQLV
ncbi:MAG: twin-arginine translocation signal domain-containing protein [Cyclobacteriaceae bacterium]|jgi:Fe-Mn family superoxide dismutase|nr:twin-arginine translocation signal domain-containing protein [Cyclobacteriaceae bacterium]